MFERVPQREHNQQLTTLLLGRGLPVVEWAGIGVTSPSEAAADDELDDQVIAVVGGVEADSEIQLPFGRDIEIY